LVIRVVFLLNILFGLGFKAFKKVSEFLFRFICFLDKVYLLLHPLWMGENIFGRGEKNRDTFIDILD
jgi:hypothetical protein